MNYRYVYMQIISAAKNQQRLGLRPKNKNDLKKNFSNQYFEFHHVLPRRLFPNWTNRDLNIVPLTAREHFFCHQLLTRIYPCKETFYAYWIMSSSHRWRCTSREYQKAKELMSQAMKGHKRALGKKHSVESRKKSSVSRKRYLVLKGDYHWFTDGKNNIQSDSCPEGFWKGRTFKNSKERNSKLSKSHKGKLWWTNGKVNVQSNDCPGEDFIRGRTNTLSDDAIQSLKIKLKTLNREKPMIWYNNGIRNFRIRKGDVIPNGLVKGRLPNRVLSK